MNDQDQYVQALTAIQRTLYIFIRSLVPHPADADEVLQNTNLVLWKKADQFQPGTNFRAWALRVAQLEVMDLRKGESCRRRRFSDAIVDQLADDLSARYDTYDARLEALRHCLTQLRASDRELIAKRYEDDLQGAEIAASVGRSRDRVYRSITRIRRALMTCVQIQLAQEDHP